MKHRTARKIPWPADWPVPTVISWSDDATWVHSRVAKVRLNGEYLFLKVYGLPGGEDTFKTFSEAHTLVREVAVYRASLQAVGIRTPENRDWSIVRSGSGCYLVYLLESYEGDSLQSVLNAAKQNAPACDAQVSTLITNLFSRSANGTVGVGVDPKPSNFVINGRGELAYVDLVWPLNSSSLGQIHEEIRPVWRNRYFTKAGICLNWLVQFSRDRVRDFSRVHERISALLYECGNTGDEGFSAFRNLASLDRTVAHLQSGDVPMWNVDLLRAAAIKLVAEQGVNGTFLEQVFNLSRTNPHQPLPHERLQTCKELILSHA